MDESPYSAGSRFAFQLERLYWQATADSGESSSWRQAFAHLERQISTALSDAERAKLLRVSRSYRRLRQISA